MGFFNGCPGSKNIKDPFPEIIKCGNCGREVEIWSDETETVCPSCKSKVKRHIGQSCLDWCSMAKECIGPEKHRKYRESKGDKNEGKDGKGKEMK